MGRSGKASWGLLGPPGAPLWASGSHLEVCWSALGAVFGRLGSRLRRPEAVVEDSGALLSRLGASCSPSVAPIGAVWGALGDLFRRLGCLLGRPWALLGSRGAILATPWGFLGQS